MGGAIERSGPPGGLYWRPLALFVAATAAGSLLVVQQVRLERAERRRAAEELGRASAFALEQQLSRSLTAPFALAALVREAGGGSRFDALAEELLAFYGGIDSLQLAPDGVLTMIHPLAGNEAALGLDLLKDPLHRADVEAAVRHRALVVAGPFTLRQGGVALAGRVAVFLGQGAQERFWGVASAIVRLPRLLEESRLDRLGEAGYDYVLLRGSRGTSGAVIARSGGDPADPLSLPVHVVGDDWRLLLAPRAGWIDYGRTAVALAAVVLVAALLALLARRVLRQPELLRQQVAARTAELERALADRQKAEEALGQARKMEALGQLAGGVAHDFNNLLTAILGYADLIKQAAPPGSLEEEGSTTILKAAQGAADLTKQLLAFARKGKVRDEIVDLRALVAEAARLLARTLDKRISVVLDLVEGPCPVRGDRAQLQQVVLNLSLNARDAMPAGGTLTLGLQRRELSAEDALSTGMAAGEHALLSVTDTGTGIPAELRNRIFDPFFTTKAEGHGTGLGLASVYGIVHGHAGSISLESEVGRGSRFLVRLPLDRTSAKAAAPEPPGALAAGTVLVVDDEPAVRALLYRALESLGLQPVAPSGPAESIEWVRQHRGVAAAAILDVSMPAIDGASCFRQLRELDPELPIVISSGYARGGRIQEMIDSGARGFLQKPYVTAELAAVLAAAPLRRKRDPA